MNQKIRTTAYSVLLICVYVTGYFDIFCFLQTPIIGPSHEVKLRIRNNALRCDCRDYDIIAKLRVFTRSLWLFRLECKTPSQLSGKEVSFSACHSTSLIYSCETLERTLACRRSRNISFEILQEAP